MQRSSIPLVLLAALTFWAGLGRGAITDADEAFYAESAREMVQSGDWLTPHYNYEPRFQKPILYYWVTAATFLVTGPNELGARAWSALAGVGLVLLTAAAGRRWFDESTGLLAGAMTATNFGYFSIARMALPDLPLTFFITLAIYAALVAMLDRERQPDRWLILAAVAAGLGFLTKGPVGVVVPVVVVIPIVLLERRSTNLTIKDFALALVLFLLIAMPWYVLMWMTHGTAYLEGFFIGDNYERFATTRFNDPRPWWFYLPVLAGGLLPWTPLTVVWLSPLAQFLRRRRDISAHDLRLLMWVALPLIFYSFSIGKQPRYVLPVLPPIALLLAGSIVERTQEWRSLDGFRVRPRPSRSVVFGCVIAGLFLTALAYLTYRARTLFVDVSPTLTLMAIMVMAVMGVLVVGISFTSVWRAAPGMLALASAAAFAVLPYGVLSSSRDSAVARMAQLLNTANPDQRPVGTYGVLVRNLVFYSGVKQTDLFDDSQFYNFLHGAEGSLVVIPVRELERIERERNIRVMRVGQVRYFDEGQIKVGTLLDPNLDEDLRVLVLVRRESGTR